MLGRYNVSREPHVAYLRKLISWEETGGVTTSSLFLPPRHECDNHDLRLLCPLSFKIKFQLFKFRSVTTNFIVILSCQPSAASSSKR